ncbi:MAG: hypothetical protein LBH22_01650 [Bacteroidales bacterium]|jgi:hypothetical protein|nr:hypothetical protein [Bacteroidales bacterium]
MKKAIITAFALILCISFCMSQNIRQAQQQQQQRDAQQRQTTQQQDQRGTQQQQAVQQQITQHSWSVNNTSTWGEAVNGIRSGGNNKAHTITISGDVAIPISSETTFGNATDITVIIEGGGGTISRSGGASGDLLRIGAGQTIVIRNLTLQGGGIITAGVFRMEGNTTISANGVSVNSGTFTMQDNARIIGNGGGVSVGNRATFVMQGNASVTRNNDVGVSVNGGTFTMQGNASVTGNRRGVFVNNKGTFTMRDGTISNNTSVGAGGGVRIEDATFIMEKGTISGNASSAHRAVFTTLCSGGGGGVYVRTGTFTMKGGMISGNTVGQLGIGAGVFAEWGSFIMHGGTVSNNTTEYWGGGVGIGFYHTASFTMHDGTISNNSAGSAGGGVFAGAKFTMNGGTISNNTTNGSGGGVNVGSDHSSNFIMGGGTISGNTANENGGGVFTGGRITKTGGIIYGNDAEPSNLRNTATSNHGHAVASGSWRNISNWRNATAGQGMNTGTYGFWLNEAEGAEERRQREQQQQQRVAEEQRQRDQQVAEERRQREEQQQQAAEERRQRDIDQRYQNTIASAERNFNQRRFEQARQDYRTALELKPENAAFINQRIAEISRPATLHIYRPRQFLVLPPRFDVLLGNKVIGRAVPNWKMITTVDTFGQQTISATADRRRGQVHLNIEPGGVYYIRVGVSGTGTDTYTPTFQLVSREVGEPEFNAIKDR